MIPIGELRVSIPIAIATYHFPYGLAFLTGVFGNSSFYFTPELAFRFSYS